MGITGLLPFLKKIHTPINIGQFAGCTVAIDAYCWLHKGAFSCAEKLALGEKTDQYVYYCMKYVENLLKKNIKPILVFDGCHLPSKKDVETSRREKRDMYKKRAAALLREGNRAEARECLRRCVDITPEMALQLMNVCRDRGVDCIVAPYEADAQLAYLNKCGIAQVIITEDSDLLLFGCEKVVFKMDFLGNGILIEKSKLNEVVQIQNGYYTFEKFRYTCIMSGCDYLASIQGIGLVKACKVFKTARNPDLKQVLKKMSTYLNMNLTVTPDYIEGFIKADNTFLYQLCFDPRSRKLVPLNPYPADIKKEELPYAGVYMPEDKALHIALGNINIYSGKMFANFNPDTFMPSKASKRKPDELHMLSIWDRNYRIRPKISDGQVANNTERPNLKSKEVVINNKLKIKKSPQKRIRSEESEPFCSDNDLNEMYNNHPVCKKLRISEEEVDVNKPVYIATPLFKISPSRQNEVDVDDDPPLPKLKPTEFFESLKGADESVKKNIMVAVSPTKEDKENSAVSPLNRFAVSSVKKERFDINAKKENSTPKHSSSSPAKRTTQTVLAKLPRKNIFSLSAKKSSVTTVTEVKSRYFGSQASKYSTKSESSDFPSKMETIDDSPADHMTSSNRSQTDLSTGQCDEEDDQCKTLTESQPALNSSSQQDSITSPGSAFSWSKFKFLKQSPQTMASPNNSVNKQFKSVVSKKTLRKKEEDEESPMRNSLSDMLKNGSSSPKMMDYSEFVKEQCVSRQNSDLSVSQTSNDFVKERCDSIQNNDLSVSQTSNEFVKEPCDSSQNGDLSVSQTSNLCSIDSDCMPDTQELTKSLDSEHYQDADDRGTTISDESNRHTFPESNIKEETEFMADCVITESSSLVIPKEDAEKKTGILDKNSSSRSLSRFGSTKSGCRISGLSKKKKSIPKDDIKQKSIKDMLSRFALKGTTEKLDHGTPLKTPADDDVEIVSVTPDSGKFNKNLQRKLLP